MHAQPDQPAFFKRSVWLGIVVGWLAQLGLKLVLPILVLTVLNLVVPAPEGSIAFEPIPMHSTDPDWLIQQTGSGPS